MEIEDRGLIFKTWKSYAKFLKAEVTQLQQFLDTNRIEAAFRGASKKRKKVE